MTTKRLNPTKKMEWTQVDKLLKEHILIKQNIAQGISEIGDLLQADNNQVLIQSLDTLRLKKEFHEFLKRTIRENPLPPNIKSISFGLFTMDDKGGPRTTIYLCGSTRTPVDDQSDWNVDPVYFPKYYLILTDFADTNKMFPNMTGDQEVAVFNGITNLLIIATLNDFKTEILNNRELMYVGAGFDSGDTYVLGSLTSEGLK